MTTAAQARLNDFYDEIVRRAYSGACNHWCRSAPNLESDNGVVLMPRDGLRQHFLDAWPELRQGRPGFLLDRYAVEQALTRILKLDSAVRLSDDVRRHLHLAEQNADDASLRDGHVNLIVQIAVFGRVVFG